MTRTADRRWRLPLVILVSLQAISTTVAVALAAINALAGAAIAPRPSLATVPVTCFVLGGALSTFSASLLMDRWGRVVGFRLGTVSALVGSLVCASATEARSFILLCLGSAILGVYAAFSQYHRYAAAEAVPEAVKSRAISWVLAGGILGAVAGPESAKLTRDLVTTPFVASYLSLGVLAIMAMLLTLNLSLPRAVLQPTRSKQVTPRALLRRPKVQLAMTSSAVGYAVMLYLMTATPLAMHHHHHGFDDAALVIEWHVLGMFAPSFFTGALISRFGVHKVINAGILLMLACVAISWLGVSLAHFWLALALLGIGWNFMFVGGTAMLTQACAPEERAVGEGSNELFIYVGNVIASLTSGLLLAKLGWQWMSLLALPFLVAVLVFAGLGARRGASDLAS